MRDRVFPTDISAALPSALAIVVGPRIEGTVGRPTDLESLRPDRP